MIDLLINSLSDLGFPVFLQGTIPPDQMYPDSFFTFWNPTSDGTAFYDNDEHAIVWEYDVMFYSVDPVLVNSMLGSAKKSLKSIGFTCTGGGFDAESDEPTHTGRGITAYYRQLT